MANIIQKQAEAKAVSKKQPQTIQDFIKVMQPGIKAALPSVITPERFTRITLSALSNNPKLQQCTPTSFLSAMMTAAQLGMEINSQLGMAYLIPYYNGKSRQLECQFQLGYKGLIDLAYRSGEVSIIQAHTVYSNDEFSYSLGLDPKLEHKPCMGDRGDPVAYYAMFKTKDGGYGFQVMSIAEVRKHSARFSKSADSGPWKTNFDEMAKKTVLKKVLKYAPLKSDFVRAISNDETTKNEIGEDMSEIPDVTEYIDAEAVPGADPATGEVLEV